MTPPRRRRPAALLLAAALGPPLASAQAAAPAAGAEGGLLAEPAEVASAAAAPPQDPWIRVNRNTYRFNDDLDRAVLKPLAQGYRAVTHRDMRRSIGHFLSNLQEPEHIVWNLAQGKVWGAFVSLLRFLINSTLGVFGLFDPATPLGLRARPEDFGQTLGAWGLGPGPYLVIPFLGPSTLRDAFGRIPDYALRFGKVLPTTSLQSDLFLLGLVSFRVSLLGVGDLASSYQAQRDAWLSQREWDVRDGEVAPAAIGEEDEELLDLFDELEGLEDFEEDGAEGESLFVPQVVPLAHGVMHPRRSAALLRAQLEVRADSPLASLRVDLLVSPRVLAAAALDAPAAPLRAEHWAPQAAQPRS